MGRRQRRFKLTSSRMFQQPLVGLVVVVFSTGSVSSLFPAIWAVSSAQYTLREPPGIPTCGVTKAMALTAAVCAETCGCATAGRGAATKAQKPALDSSTAAVSRRERGAAMVAADPQKSTAPASENLKGDLGARKDRRNLAGPLPKAEWITSTCWRPANTYENHQTNP